MIERVIAGGQTGADQGGLRAARACGIPTGGWIPLGWRTEDGPAPWLADWGLREHSSPEFPPRTHANARDSDGTIWFGSGDSRGFGCTANGCRKAGKPMLAVTTRRIKPEGVVAWIRQHQIRTLNVAGNRESASPGIGARVEAYLAEVFRLLARGEG